jgi:spermidine synthase
MTRQARFSRASWQAIAAVAWAGVFAGCPSALTRPPGLPGEVGKTSRILFDRQSPYGRVLVVDDGHERALRFGNLDGADQSTIVPGRPGAVPLEYARYAVLGLAYHGAPRTLLMVGLGGGTFTTMVHRVRPDIAIDAVEIDPVVVEVARAFFGLREDDGYRVHVADGADWVATTRGGPYDYVLLDSYSGESIPEPLRTVAFFQAVRARLTAGGVVGMNVAEPQAEGAEAMRAFRAVFSVFACVQAPNDGNLLLFGTAGPRDPPEPAAVAAWLAGWDALGKTEFSARALVGSRPASRDCP